MARRYYYKDIQNPITGQSIRVTASDKFVLASKVQRQYEQWDRFAAILAKKSERQIADEKTRAVLNDIQALRSILKATLDVDDKINWRAKLDEKPYAERVPTKDAYINKSLSKNLRFIGAFKKRAVEQENNELKAYETAVEGYESRKAEWEKAQKQHNVAVAKQKIAYDKGDEEGVENYLSMVMDNSQYPDVITVNTEIFFSPVTKTALVEIMLPSKESIPSITAYRYISSRNVTEPKQMKAKEFSAFYDDVQYQIVLRTIHEIFESDYKEHIQAVVINGNADVRDKATGKMSTKAILTVQAQREDFLSIDLANVEPQACFRYLKGISAGPLVELTPIKPILKLNRHDKRIIEANNVLDEFNPAQNLATMEWEKFEVLIRDLFAKEFSGDGMAVEVTRASRDAGVDGIAFDEDPIRGGKFVIQAKRYNNLVPVSAVRDLYGTVMNEGAVKGILVTTSYYGPDAVAFAKDKPLTLINGQELLYMFQKHGSDFKIELQKVKRASRLSF